MPGSLYAEELFVLGFDALYLVLIGCVVLILVFEFDLLSHVESIFVEVVVASPLEVDGHGRNEVELDFLLVGCDFDELSVADLHPPDFFIQFVLFVGGVFYH